MFLIDRDENRAIPISRKTFQELGFQERKHLQEWICKDPDILGENLLIIQKEFCGFDDTRERLDLLAIDENGNLVIIENKLDDSGRDVVWQALKYASYCSGLTKGDIKDIFQSYLDEQGNDERAEEILCEFLGIEDFNEVELNNDDQRIIMTAANFRKEVTSTTMWLLDHNIRIKCIRVTPYELDDQILLDAEQIIPTVDAEDYLIKIAKKKQEELISRVQNQTRYAVLVKFWARLLQDMDEISDLFKNVNPIKDNWLSCGSGYSGIIYSFKITGRFARIELWINWGSKEDNKILFDQIATHKEHIEEAFGDELDWQRLDNGKASRIAYTLTGVSLFNEDDWPQMIEFMTSHMIKFEIIMKPILNRIMNQ